MSDIIRTHPILNNLQAEYESYIPTLSPFEDKINNNSKVKNILAYSSILMCIGEEAGLLYNKGWNNSMASLTRDFLECYAIIKTLIKSYNSTDFDEYMKYLYYLEIYQTKSLIIGYKKDNTFNSNQKQTIINTKLEHIKFIIEEYFPEYKRFVNGSDLYKSIFKVWDMMNSKYDKCKYNVYKGEQIGRSLIDNQAWIADYGSPIEGAMVIYKILCNSAHNNISSVIERVVHNNVFMMNAESDEVLVSLNLVSYCMKDVNVALKRLLESI